MDKIFKNNFSNEFNKIISEKKEILLKIIKILNLINEECESDKLKEYTNMINYSFDELKLIDNFIIKNFGKDKFDLSNNILLDIISELSNTIKQKELILSSFINELKEKINSLNKNVNKSDVRPHFYDEKI